MWEIKVFENLQGFSLTYFSDLSTKLYYSSLLLKLTKQKNLRLRQYICSFHLLSWGFSQASLLDF